MTRGKFTLVSWGSGVSKSLGILLKTRWGSLLESLVALPLYRSVINSSLGAISL